jgi:YVTN family beta-propeller protein
MAITPGGKTLYVVGANINLGSGWVTPISVAVGKAAPSIQVKARPDAIAITPDGKTLYVADAGSDTVTPISVATNTAGPRITVGPAPGRNRHDAGREAGLCSLHWLRRARSRTAR